MRTLLPLAAALAFSLAGEPKKSALEYPAHAESAAADIGVDYMVHSYSDEGQMYFTKDYLVCEVAIYPKAPLELTGASFELRINQSKRPIPETSAELVAAAVKVPEWTGNDVGVLGAPPGVGRFPGDPNGAPRYPKPPHAPDDPHKPQTPVKDAGQIALDHALKPGKITGPAAGNVYFAYSGNMKKVKTVSLVFHTVSGDIEIPVR